VNGGKSLLVESFSTAALAELMPGIKLSADILEELTQRNQSIR
jgi:hypothetical protein